MNRINCRFQEPTPTVTPLRIRPAIREPVPFVLVCTAVPASHQRHANMIESRRPILLEIGPAMMEPMIEPAASDEPIAPWTIPAGLLKYVLYCSVPMIADMDEISKPNNIPPTVATKAMK